MPRPAKPQELHKLNGTVTQATAGVGESRIPPGRPKWGNLPKACRGTFKRICRLLEERQHLTTGDREIITVYALAEERLWRFKNELDVQGWTIQDAEKGEVDNPLCKHFYKAENVVMTCLYRLGLDPMQRDKAKRTKTLKEQEMDEMDKLLARSANVVPFTVPEIEIEEPEPAPEPA